MVDILAFGAHPDDVEFGCGGILCKAKEQGKTLAICDLTSGDKATHGSVAERQAEGMRAAKLLNAERTFLSFSDCEVADTYEGRVELVKVIRHFQPKLVLAPLYQGTGSHPDHFACGQLARAACRLARFGGVLPTLPTHHVDGILHYLMPWEGTPDFLVDISEQVEQWKKLINIHTSQHQTKPYLDWCLRQSSSLGTLIDAAHAQGLVKGNPIVIDDLLDVSRSTREL